MVTGIETAGLVLASIPLVISALEHYRNGLQPFKEFARYHSELTKLHRLIKLETTKLLNTCELLLRRLADGSYLASLLQNPGGELWRGEPLRSRISLFLSSSIESFDNAIQEINETLRDLLSQLDVDPTGKPKRTDRESLLRVIDRLKFAFFDRDKRKMLQKKLEKGNRSLAELVGANLILAPLRSGRALQASQFEQIRQNACSMHDLLTLGPWTCQCSTPHNANLRLEARVSEEASLSQPSPDIVTPVRFRVLFTFTATDDTQTTQWDCRDTDLMPMADDARRSTPSALPALSAPSLQGSSPEQIQDLCAALRRACDGTDCLGYLFDGSRKKTLVLYSMAPRPRSLPSCDIVKLEKLLRGTRNTSASTSVPAVPNLTRKDRLVLALTLASSVLQLYTTPWLDDRWGKDDIFFFPQPNGNGKPMIAQPYISKSFSSDHSHGLAHANQRARSVSRVIRNKALFGLGVMLIELCFGKSLEDMREPEDLDENGNPNAYTDIATAHRLIDDVYSELGSRYGDAVRRCIRCDFDQREESFESDEFRQAVYQRVVVPLEDDLRDFCGGKLPLR